MVFAILVSLVALCLAIIACVASSEGPTMEQFRGLRGNVNGDINFLAERVSKLFDLYATLNGNTLSTFNKSAETANSHKAVMTDMQKQIDELRDFFGLEHFIKAEKSVSTGEVLETGLRKVKKS